MDAVLNRKRAGAISRRAFVRGLAGVVAGASTLPVLTTHAGEPAAESLKAHAARRGLFFGCAVQKRLLDAHPDFASAVIREAGILVAENEMKWRPLQRNARQPPDYREADGIVDFASANAMAMRGHTLVWHQNPPVWAEPLLAGPNGPRLMLDHVRAVAGHFRGRILEWDVVNEAIEPADGRADSLRGWPLYERGGYDFIADCFHAAHEADPKARLFYNDYDLEYDTRVHALRRKGTLRLLEELKRRNAPVHGLGIQSHLTVGNRFSEPVFRHFLAEAAAMGLRITLTELDISDRRLDGPVDYRDQKVADAAREFLSVALDEPATGGVLTWGLSDRFSWLNEGRPRADQSVQRSLPLDEAYGRKPVWSVMADCFDKAPAR